MADSILNPYAALQVRDFRLFILSRLFITLAVMIQAVVVGWQVYEITKDPLSLGLIGLAEAIPAVGFALYGGHVADRTDRKKIIVTVIAFTLFCSIGLLVMNIKYSGASALQTALPLYSIIFLIG